MVGDLKRSTALCEVWGELSYEMKDEAFEIWTSPAAPRTNLIVEYLGGHGSQRHSNNTTPVSMASQDEPLCEVMTEPSVGNVRAAITGKSFPFYNTNNTSVAIPEDSSDVLDDSDDPPPPPDVIKNTPDNSLCPPTKKEDDISPPLGHTTTQTVGMNLGTDDKNKKHATAPPLTDVNTLVSQDALVTTLKKVGGTSTPAARGDNTPAGGSDRRDCVHTTKGVCNIHGEGAEKRWRGGHVMARKPNGKTFKKYVRESYFVCDLSLTGRTKLKQTKLSFTKLKQEDRKGEADDVQKGTYFNYTCKEGQNASCERGGPAR